MARFRLWQLRALSLSLALLAPLLLLEIGLAWKKPQLTWSRLIKGRAKHFSLLKVFAASDYLPFTLRPGASDVIQTVDFRHRWRINWQGFRDADRSLDKGDNEYRILALGDSFTAGHGVEWDEAWPKVLEERLQNRTRPVRVLNAGYTGGYAPDCYYAYMKRNLSILAPDAVVIALYAGNDVYEMLDHYDFEVDDTGLPTRVLSKGRWVDDLGRRRLSKAADRAFVYRFPILRDSHAWIWLTERLTQGECWAGEPNTSHRAVYTQAMEQAYRRTVACLIGAKRLAKESGIDLLVAIIPTSFQVDRRVPDPAVSDERNDLAMPQRRWTCDLESQQIETLDLRKPLESAWLANQRDIWTLYYPNDRHFNVEGQRVMADAILAKLAAILPGEKPSEAPNNDPVQLAAAPEQRSPGKR